MSLVLCVKIQTRKNSQICNKENENSDGWTYVKNNIVLCTVELTQKNWGESEQYHS